MITWKYYTIKREIQRCKIWVELDTFKFTLVIDAIMNNAIKYSPDGGGNGPDDW